MSKNSAFDAITDPLPQRISTGLNKVALALKFQATKSAALHGVSALQANILSLLATAPTGLRPSSLSERLAVTAPTITQSVAALTEKELVERVAVPEDGRASLVRLTVKGRNEARGMSSWPEFLSVAIESLSEEEKAVFWKGLLKVILSLQHQGHIPTSEMCVTCTHFRPNVHDNSSMPHHCNLVNAPMANSHLRLECPEHVLAEPTQRDAARQEFLRT